MAAKDDKDNVEEVQSRNTRLREALSNAYSALLGDQAVKSFSAFTFEEALNNQIERIEGSGTQLRPNLLARVDRIENNMLQAIAQLKSLPPEMFREANQSTDVNTPNDPNAQ